ncbi:hypothetical protein ABZ070_34715 [Streptomyces sp. NPDC006283]|uniref:hypothetical protein n=1 Tax=Streptomyces sp. NPDC006283 TaxID=3156741 RepID=UPI0033BC58B5
MDAVRRPEPASTDDDGYSATALESHWFELPEQSATTRLADTVRAPEPEHHIAPDRVDAAVHRFGPGVTAAALRHGTPPPQPAISARPRRYSLAFLRRYTLAALVLLGVLGYFAWQRLGPDLAVQEVSVRATPKAPACASTTDVVGVVNTNGRAGTLTYRWVRSDGTDSGPLREPVSRGQRKANLHLLWSFNGKGIHPARAELRIISPTAHTASVNFTYRCR